MNHKALFSVLLSTLAFGATIQASQFRETLPSSGQIDVSITNKTEDQQICTASVNTPTWKQVEGGWAQQKVGSQKAFRLNPGATENVSFIVYLAKQDALTATVSVTTSRPVSSSQTFSAQVSKDNQVATVTALLAAQQRVSE